MTHGEHGCPDCTDGIEHCHGTLTEHADGQVACTEDGCRLTAAAHAWAGRCSDLDPGCRCAPVIPARAA